MEHWPSLSQRYGGASFKMEFMENGFIKIYFFPGDTSVPSDQKLHLVAIAISIALAIQVVSSTLIGAGLPLIVGKFKGDPAVVASPAITTIVDITGLLIYFSTVKFILGV